MLETFRSFKSGVREMICLLRVVARKNVTLSHIFLQHLFLQIERYKVVCFCWILRGLPQVLSTNWSWNEVSRGESRICESSSIFAQTFMSARITIYAVSLGIVATYFSKIDEQAGSSSRIASRSKQVYYLRQLYSRRKLSVKKAFFDYSYSQLTWSFQVLIFIFYLGCNDLNDLSIH